MSSNATCHMQGAPEKSPPLFQDGNLDIQGLSYNHIPELKTYFRSFYQLITYAPIS